MSIKQYQSMIQITMKKIMELTKATMSKKRLSTSSAFAMTNNRLIKKRYPTRIKQNEEKRTFRRLTWTFSLETLSCSDDLMPKWSSTIPWTVSCSMNMPEKCSVLPSRFVRNETKFKRRYSVIFLTNDGPCWYHKGKKECLVFSVQKGKIHLMTKTKVGWRS